MTAAAGFPRGIQLRPPSVDCRRLPAELAASTVRSVAKSGDGVITVTLVDVAITWVHAFWPDARTNSPPLVGAANSVWPPEGDSAIFSSPMLAPTRPVLMSCQELPRSLDAYTPSPWVAAYTVPSCGKLGERRIAETG